MDSWRCPTGLGTTLALLGGLSLSPAVADSTALTLGGLGAALLLLESRWRRHSLPLSVLSLALLGMATGMLRFVPDPPVIPRHEKAWVAGEIDRWEFSSRGILADLRIHRVGERRLASPVPARLYGPGAWGATPRSSWIGVFVRILPGRGTTNPGAWGFRQTTLIAGPQAVPTWGPTAPASIHRIRTAVSLYCRTHLGGFPGRLGEAVLLGRSRALLPAERDTFRRSGASHLVAVSGLHVGLVVMLVLLVVSPFPPGVRWMGVTAAAYGYAMLSGWSPSALRAATWIGVAFLGSVLHRPRPGISWLVLVLPWLLWSQPLLATSVGFRLSLGAVAGILFFLELAGSGKPKHRLLSPVVVSLGAQWGTLPVIVTVFGQLAPLALLPNLIAIPLTALFLPALAFSMIVSSVAPAASLFLEASRVLALAIRETLARSGEWLPFWTGLSPAAPVLSVLPAALMILWFSAPKPLRQRRGLRGGGLLAVVGVTATLLIPAPGPPGPWVAFLDVGQGDAAVLRLSDQSVWVVDVGDDRGPGDAARNALLPFLRHMGIRRVDGLILSHRHRDHVGALGSFLSAVSVHRVFDAGYGPATGTSFRVDSTLSAHGHWPCLVAAGDTLYSGPGIQMVAQGPPRGDPERELPGDSLNNVSLVVRVEDGLLDVLFTGDAETQAENRCLKRSDFLRSRILKVGHHGSATSTTEAFLTSVRPELAVISSGVGNRFGHPRPETLERLHRHGVRVFRTDLQGAVVLRFRADSLLVRTHPPETRPAF